MKKLFLLILLFICVTVYAQRSGNYLQAALKAERWIHSQEINKKDSGLAWYDTRDSLYSTSDIYHGNSGVVLFYLELYNITKNPGYLHTAESGMKYILSKPDTSLYPWTAGKAADIIYTSHQVYLQTKDPLYKNSAIKYLNQLNKQIVQVDTLIQFMHVATYYHVGFIFLYADRHKIIEDALTPAKRIGDIFLKGSIKEKAGRRWTWFSNADTAEKTSLNNFSHGTSGVASYLADLYTQTNDKKYLQAATEAGDYLLSISNDSGWVPLFYPYIKSRYYLSVCHGPAGTSRLYYQLSKITKDKKWEDQIRIAAGSVMQSGIPEKLTAGFWNNVSQCCGSAGVAEWYIHLNEHYSDPNYIAFSKRMLDDIIKRGTVEKDMISWTQAENRVQPDLLQAQTGYGQGAAGIGIALLHMYALENKKHTLIKLPEDPF
ncbi:MAG TPA: lanthionine synthetase LanC family protein [Chitinophagaceae bacterium]|nr:lanthionine synthetase LanC family protein [Chitinophagaceae bacterium]